MRFPENLKYTKDHEWARIEGNKVVVGITDHAQSALGDIVFVELPTVGRQLKAGETFGVVESIKAVSDLYAPLTGKVLAINETLAGDPSILNQKPHDQAWLIELEVSDSGELSKLMDAGAYNSYVQSLR